MAQNDNDFPAVEVNPNRPYDSIRELYLCEEPALLASLPRMDGSVGEALESIEGLPPDLIQLPSGCPFAPRCKFTQDKCLVENPPLEEISPGHSIACWIDIDTGTLR